MGKIAFWHSPHLNGRNKERLEAINKIIRQYQEKGYVLTLRQLYYRLVSRDVIPNTVQEYSKLSQLLKKGRMAGIVDWSAIEDRLREPKAPYCVKDVVDALGDTIEQYRYDRMRDQIEHIEVWTEKDALSGVLYRVTQHYQIPLVVNRGYSSITAMFNAFKRIHFAWNHGKGTTILYLGDHDPSGLDMVRDINDRLQEFSLTSSDFNLRHIALTYEQIAHYNPPPNPAKISDPRAGGYIANHGSQSWEVDALEPEVLDKLLTENIEGLIDLDKFNALLKAERKDKKDLAKLLEVYKSWESD